MKTVEVRAGQCLAQAAFSGNMTLLKGLSQVFHSIKGDPHHENALFYAVAGGKIEAVKWLLEMGVDPMPQNCIWHAQYYGHTEILEELTRAVTFGCSEPSPLQL